MECADKRSVIVGLGKRPDLTAIDGGRKLAPNIIASAEIRTERLEKGLDDRKWVLGTRRRILS